MNFWCGLRARPGSKTLPHDSVDGLARWEKRFQFFKNVTKVSMTGSTQSRIFFDAASIYFFKRGIWISSDAKCFSEQIWHRILKITKFLEKAYWFYMYTPATLDSWLTICRAITKQLGSSLIYRPPMFYGCPRPWSLVLLLAFCPQHKWNGRCRQNWVIDLCSLWLDALGIVGVRIFIAMCHIDFKFDLLSDEVLKSSSYARQ